MPAKLLAEYAQIRFVVAVVERIGRPVKKAGNRVFPEEGLECLEGRSKERLVAGRVARDALEGFRVETAIVATYAEAARQLDRACEVSGSLRVASIGFGQVAIDLTRSPATVSGVPLSRLLEKLSPDLGEPALRGHVGAS